MCARRRNPLVPVQFLVSTIRCVPAARRRVMTASSGVTLEERGVAPFHSDTCPRHERNKVRHGLPPSLSSRVEHQVLGYLICPKPFGGTEPEDHPSGGKRDRGS